MGGIVGVGALAGIGFTVSLFVTGLAFDDLVQQDEAKIGILVASTIADRGVGDPLPSQRATAADHVAAEADAPS